MATIATRVFGDGTSTLFTLYNEEFVRSLGFTNGWTRIRIGMLCAVQASGNFTQTTECGFGLCTGASPIENTRGFRSTNTTNWCGLAFTALVFSTTAFTYNAGPPSYVSSTALSMIARRGNSDVQSRQDAIQWFMPTAGSGNRGFVMLDFIKTAGLGSVTVTNFVPKTAATAQVNYTMADLIQAGEQIKVTNSVTMKQTAISQHASNPMSTDESFGQFDTLSIAWSTAAVPLEVYGIVAYAIYSITL